ncbi:MAG: hypothetical protein WDN04_06210 [Rhodospirillales bacterium]
MSRINPAEAARAWIVSQAFLFILATGILLGDRPNHRSPLAGILDVADASGL